MGLSVTPAAAPRSRLKRTLFAALGLVIFIVLLLPVAAAFLLRPVARARVIDLLEERFDRVQLETLDIRIRPGLNLIPTISASGTGLSLSLAGRNDAPPFITMDEFQVEVEIQSLVRKPVHVRSLDLDELRIQIPPRRLGEEETESEEAPPPPFVVDELVADGAVLRILSRKPEKEPLQFDLHQLRVLSAGVGQPMRFEALLDNPKPPGSIKTHGEFGPLTLSEPGDSPVSGDYVFRDADLSVFGGIGGTLYSEGQFDGVLDRIGVHGFTDMADFQLKSVGNPVHLRTEFDAIVDGTNGNTLLVPVNAVLDGSRFRALGGVARVPETGKGKTVCVDAEGSDGRIEDFLRLAMKSERPIMTGTIRFQSMVRIPPGDVDVVKKLELEGEFAVESAFFPEAKVQEKVNKLSAAGTSDKDAPEALASLREERVLSDIRGAFHLSRGVISLSAVSFSVPGAAVTLEGTYGLETEKIDLHGELRLDAELSETTTGFKSFLLKLVGPLFKRKDAGAVVPIKIAGTPDKPAFGLELGRVLTREEVAPLVPASEKFRRPARTCADVLDLPDLPAPAETKEATRSDSASRPEEAQGKPEPH
jgi:hypothetical protein